jgi:exosortase/archaeosortase family protein
LNSEAIIFPNHKVFPQVYIPNHPFNDIFSITPDCIAAPVFGILIGLTTCVPPSKDPLSRKRFNWRKATTLGMTVIIFYLLNIFRLVFLLYFTYIGIPFEFIHQSLFFLTAIIGAIIFIVILHKFLPEIFISLYYIYPLIKNSKTDY